MMLRALLGRFFSRIRDHAVDFLLRDGMDRKLVLLAIASFVLWFSGSLLFIGVSTLRRVQSAEHWVHTSGRVIGRAISVEYSKRSLLYCARWRYAYEVAGRPYVGDQELIVGATCFGSEEKAQRYLLSWPPQPATPVDVIYDPAAPGQAALFIALQRSEDRGWVSVKFGLVVIGVAIAVYVLFEFRRRRRALKEPEKIGINHSSRKA